jgi:nucleoside-diphosphate-sugar epimerase
MHVLLTGGCGYVGTALTAKLLGSGIDVTVVDAQWFGNFLPPARGLRVIAEDVRNTDRIPLDGVDSVIHLANVANDPCAELDSKLSWEVNCLATMRLADRAARSGVTQFIYASSGSVYGVKSEEQVTEGLSTEPISDYNKTKMVSDRVVLSYSGDMLVQCIRPATVCGVSQRMRLDLSVNLLTMQALTKGEITVLGGDQTRPNIHIHDMVRTYLHFLTAGRQHTGVFNAGFENMSILEIARLVQEFVPAKIIIKPSMDPRSYRLNSDKLCATGFGAEKLVKNAISEIKGAYRAGLLREDDRWYNIRWMKRQQPIAA